MSDPSHSVMHMLSHASAPSVVAACRHCDRETVWLQLYNGSWRLFDATETVTDQTFDGNRFAVDGRSRLVVDLDNVRESRRPARCLTLHKFRCPESFDESRHYRRRPRQPNDIDYSDFWEKFGMRKKSSDPRFGATG